MDSTNPYRPPAAELTAAAPEQAQVVRRTACVWVLIVYYGLGFVAIIGTEAAIASGAYPVHVEQTEPLRLLRVVISLGTSGAVVVLFFQMRVAVIIPLIIGGIWSIWSRWRTGFGPPTEGVNPEVARMATMITKSSLAVGTLTLIATLSYIRHLWNQGALRPIRQKKTTAPR